METRLGKIRYIDVGIGGYQDAQFGLSVDLGGDGWGVGDFKGMWGMEPDKHCKWNKSDQDKAFSDVMHLINNLLHDAKKQYLKDLKGVPVEVTLDGNALKSWRILTEVV